MRNKKIIIVALCLIVSFAGLMFYANYVQVSAKSVFEQDGYVLNSSLQSTNAKTEQNQRYYFKADSTYQKTWASKILFHDTESSKVVLGAMSYLHYANGDMGAFTDGVLVDLNKLNEKPITYYRIENGSILKKTGNSYQMNYLGKKITMTNFIWKLSDSKYIVVSPTMKLTLGNNTVKDMKGYTEVEIQDKGIITFHNQDASYQTIVDGSNIQLGDGTTIDFNTKEISLKGKNLLSLTQMLVDSNSNIEIVPAENKSKPQNEQANKNGQNNQNNAQNGANGGNNANGGNGNGGNGNGGNGNGGNGNGNGNANAGNQPPTNIDLGGNKQPKEPDNGTTTPPGEGEEPKESNKTIPTVQITSMKTSLQGVSVKGTINDPDDLLTTAGVQAKIFEKSSNKQVYVTTFNKGQQTFDMNVDSLNTNTDYVLIISGTYVFNKVEYTNDLLNKQFTTNQLDLSYKQNEASDTSLTYKVNLDKDSKITNATLSLYNSDKVEVSSVVLGDAEINQAKGAEGYLAVFNNLTPDTTYYSKMKNIIYDSATVPDAGDFVETKTLKTTPTLEMPTVTTDKRNGVFTFYPGKVTDPNHGIQKYRFEVVDAVDTSNVVFTVNRDTLGNVEVPVDGVNILRKHNYFYRIKAIFDDNEKTIEVASPNSGMFSLDTKNLPTVTFTATAIQPDSITGTIHVSDADNVILRGNVPKANRISRIEVAGTDAVNKPLNLGASQFTDINDGWNGQIDIPIDLTGLRSNEDHTFQLYADVNLGEQSNTPGEFDRPRYYIGEVHVKTQPTTALAVTVNKNNGNDPAILNNKFVLDTQLEAIDPTDPTDVTDSDYQASTLASLNYTIYSGTVSADDIKTNKAKQVGTGTVKATGTSAQDHNSSIKQTLYDAVGQIESGSTNVNWNTYQPNTATIYFTQGTDYAGNAVTLNGNSVYSFNVNAGALNPPANQHDALNVTTITNSMLGNAANNTTYASINNNKKYTDLNDNTVVGFTYQPKLNNSAGAIRTITYNFFDMNGKNSFPNVMNTTQTLTINDKSIPAMVIPVGYGVYGNDRVNGRLTRGHRYQIAYTATADMNFDGTDETTVTNLDNAGRLMDAPRQHATYTSKIYLDATTHIATLKYKLTDVDAYYRGTDKTHIPTVQTAYDNSGNVIGTVNGNIQVDPNNWQTLTIPNTVAGLSATSVNVNNYTQVDYPGSTPGTADALTEITRQRVYDVPEAPATSVAASESIVDNNMYISLQPVDTTTDGENAFLKTMDQVTAAKITVSDANDSTNSVVLDNLPITPDKTVSTHGLITIGLQKLSKLQGKTLHVQTQLYFVSGNAFTDLDHLAPNTNYAIELVRPDSLIPLYLYNNGSATLQQQTADSLHASGSMFNIAINGNNLGITSKLNNQNVTYGYKYGTFPLVINMGATSNNVILKEITGSNVPTTIDTGSESFDAVAATIKMRNKNDQLDFVGGIDRVQLGYTLDMTNATQAADSLLHFELREQPQGGGILDDNTPVAIEFTAPIDQANNGTRVTTFLGDPTHPLSVGTTYSVKPYIVVAGGQHKYLYDADSGKIGTSYTFTTSNSIKVTNITGSLQNSQDATGTVTRNMNVNYTLSQTGYTRIHYTVYGGYDEATKTYADETNNTPVIDEDATNLDPTLTAQSASFAVGPGTGQLQLSKQYKVVITVYSTNTPYNQGEATLGTANFESKLASLRNPIVNMQLQPGIDTTTTPSSLNIKAIINVTDLDYAGTNSKYKIALFDENGNDITPADIKAAEYDYATKNQVVMFSNAGLKENTTYRVQLTTSIGLNADGVTTDYTSSSNVTTVNNFGVGLGDVELVKSATPNSADLLFYGSTNLQTVKMISYTVYNTDDGTTSTVTKEPFNITLAGSGSNQYWWHTIKGFNKSGRYLVEVQFLAGDNTLIGTKSLSLNYR